MGKKFNQIFIKIFNRKIEITTFIELITFGLSNNIRIFNFEADSYNK